MKKGKTRKPQVGRRKIVENHHASNPDATSVTVEQAGQRVANSMSGLGRRGYRSNG